MIKDMTSKLTDSYRKDSDSNMVKVLNMIGSELETLKNTFFTIQESRDIDTATGKTLDRLGGNVQEFRGQKDEELYRQFIKTKIRANLSGGEIETLIQVLNVFFEGNLKSVQEAWSLEDGSVYDGEPASIVITFFTTPINIPYEAIDRVLAGGVSGYYYREDTGVRQLALVSSTDEFQSIFKHCGTFECGEDVL